MGCDYYIATYLQVYFIYKEELFTLRIDRKRIPQWGDGCDQYRGYDRRIFKKGRWNVENEKHDQDYYEELVDREMFRLFDDKFSYNSDPNYKSYSSCRDFRTTSEYFIITGTIDNSDFEMGHARIMKIAAIKESEERY